MFFNSLHYDCDYISKIEIKKTLIITYIYVIEDILEYKI